MEQRTKRTGARKIETSPLGVNLEVTGAALADQARKRITWHQQIAAEQSAVLKRIPPDNPNELQSTDGWKHEARRRELIECVRGHEEHVRFLEFVRRHLKPRRTYRLSLQDLSYLEIAPKGRYI